MSEDKKGRWFGFFFKWRKESDDPTYPIQRISRNTPGKVVEEKEGVTG